MTHRATRAARGDVVVLRNGDTPRAAHDYAACCALARRLAALKGYAFAGEHDARAHRDPLRHRYFVPLDTVVGAEVAHALGIADAHDLFGGVVPHAFVATKCISHPLVDDRADAPPGWSHAFARRVDGVVLAGFAAFTPEQAVVAGTKLLAHGTMRVKRALGIGGAGQSVVHDRAGLERAVAAIDADEIAHFGVVVEQDLADVTTYSIGQVRVDDTLLTYSGTQQVTRNTAGHEVYGGSDLLVARGGFDALLALVRTDTERRAIEQARVYDRAAFDCFRGMFASRRNYDVAHGRDARGRACSGVLEQSWRIGGASGAEIAALAALRADASLCAVRARSREVYGDAEPLPPGADVHYRGTDAHGGAFMKYSLAMPYADAR
ncbi:MAG: DUF3182 family protein [Rudaea sp.]